MSIVCKPLSARWQRQKLCGQAGFEFFDHTGWMAYTPVSDCRTVHGVVLTEGSCDRCVQEAKAQLQAQYPHLYALLPRS